MSQHLGNAFNEYTLCQANFSYKSMACKVPSEMFFIPHIFAIVFKPVDKVEYVATGNKAPVLFLFWYFVIISNGIFNNGILHITPVLCLSKYNHNPSSNFFTFSFVRYAKSTYDTPVKPQKMNKSRISSYSLLRLVNTTLIIASTSLITKYSRSFRCTGIWYEEKGLQSNYLLLCSMEIILFSGAI